MGPLQPLEPNLVTNIPKLLTSIASVLWAGLGLIAFMRLFPSLQKLLDSAGRRAFTVKLGGQELTMAEANEQQRQLLSDLQAQVIELKASLNPGEADVASAKDSAARAPTEGRRAVLWVDDQPKNNSYFVQRLLDEGVEVDLALTTLDGLRRFERSEYAAVISDMGRQEDGEYRGEAGLALLRQLRELDSTVPFIIFCSRRGVATHRATALALGATGISASGTELLGFLRDAVPTGRA